jgi:hypothetical protein
MKIRDHPRIVYWPPTWKESVGNEIISSDKSEDLILKEVKLLPQPPNDYHNYILIFAENRRKSGNIFRSINAAKTFSSIIIFMRDFDFLDNFYQKLKSSLGKTIREIGDSEI